MPKRLMLNRLVNIDNARACPNHTESAKQRLPKSSKWTTPSREPASRWIEIALSEKLGAKGTRRLTLHIPLAMQAHQSQSTAPYPSEGRWVTAWHSAAVARARTVATEKIKAWPFRRGPAWRS